MFKRAGLEEIHTRDYTSEMVGMVKDPVEKRVGLDVSLDLVVECDCSESLS
jgi:hypothetical protein